MHVGKFGERILCTAKLGKATRTTEFHLNGGGVQGGAEVTPPPQWSWKLCGQPRNAFTQEPPAAVLCRTKGGLPRLFRTPAKATRHATKP